jgi:hypothetical protein
MVCPGPGTISAVKVGVHKMRLRDARYLWTLITAAALVTGCSAFLTLGCAGTPASTGATATSGVSSSQVTTTEAPTTTTSVLAQPVKGLYVTAEAAGDSEKLAGLVKIADESEINAFVIDIKDDTGHVTYDADVPSVRQFGLADARIKDVDALIAKLNQHDIVPIARLACFPDPALASIRPDLAVKSKATGSNWLDPKNHMYLDPYNRDVWEYLVEIAEDAARHGFQEIRFDSVRFPTVTADTGDPFYPSENGSKEDAIASFLAFARTRLRGLGVAVSASTFFVDDAVAGVNLRKISASVDFLCPFIFPSHFSSGFSGLEDPGAHPYELVTNALKDVETRVAGTGALVRPWLQAFSLGSPPYGAAEIKAEIQAVTDLGLDGWALWNPKLEYPVDALAPE